MLDIVYRGAIYNYSGYARSRHLLLELKRQGLNVKVKPFSVKETPISQLSDLKALEAMEVNRYVSVINGIALQFYRDPDAAYNIGYTMFEATALPSSWVKKCNEMDEIWVPSMYNKKMFEISGVKPPVYVIPYGIDPSMWPHSPQQSDKFTFLSIGTYIDRKGWDILLQAFLKEFSEPDVRLLIKFDGSNKHISSEMNNLCDQYPGRSEVMLGDAQVSDEAMSNLYNMADCYVLPSRGEAFGLTYLESLACGVPVIATNEGGHLDFLNKNNSWLVKIRDYKPVSARLGLINQYYRNLSFPEPDEQHLRSCMREAYSDRDLLKYKTRNSMVGIEKFYYSNIANVVKDRLIEIGGKL